MTPWDRYKAQNPTQPTNHELEYLQAKDSGYGGGSLFGNIGASHHAKNRVSRSVASRKSTLGDFFAFMMIVVASIFAFTTVLENSNEIWKAVAGAVLTMYVCGKVYEINFVKKSFSILAWSGLIGAALYFLDQTAN